MRSLLLRLWEKESVKVNFGTRKGKNAEFNGLGIDGRELLQMQPRAKYTQNQVRYLKIRQMSRQVMIRKSIMKVMETAIEGRYFQR